ASGVAGVFGGALCDDVKCPPDAEWTQPADGPVGSTFRSEERPDHDGVDLLAERGAEVVAASAGVVTTSICQASKDGDDYGCDRDGSWEVLGCGWFVKIRHAHDVATMYCHFGQQPEVEIGDAVTTGQLLGYVGSTGNSSEPHLHFETQTGGNFGSTGAVDPVDFMADRDAPLE
ncbi:MAG: M23 family metallopeptidase, partial [Stackebrandtia sp.]